MHNFHSLVTKRNSLNHSLGHLKSICQHYGKQISDDLLSHFSINQPNQFFDYELHASNYGLEEFFNQFNGKDPSINLRRFLDKLSKIEKPSNIKLVSKDNSFLGVFNFLDVDSRLKVTIKHSTTLSMNSTAVVGLELLLPNGKLLYEKSLEQPMATNNLMLSMCDLQLEVIRLDVNNKMQLECEHDYVNQAIFELFIVDSLSSNADLERHSGIFGVLTPDPTQYYSNFNYPETRILAACLSNIPKIEMARRISVLSGYTKFYLGESEVKKIEQGLSEFMLSGPNEQDCIEFIAAADLYNVNIGTSNSTFIAKHINAIDEFKGCGVFQGSWHSLLKF
ncbi:hypothetical protein HNW13_017685 [Shewanella sp. BF02_Schw]|uniref:hypothetical protein n=1 Tax=Shewanella sp. BF02_Schw TaxID=394908 RepID=UPI001781454E|nr:hypothetical protein [Shewanella sp. BF02_Schw]MBO1897571.1 hypothetical protein [Shewanella sp. BF02_Schw]